MDVSIVILNYKSSRLVKQQLRYFFSQPCSVSVEIIVVDNNSRDGVATMLSENFPSVRFIQAKSNRGYAAGNNIGIAASKGAYIMVVNPDIVLSTNAVETLYAFMQKSSRVGLAGPRLVNADGSHQFSISRFPDFWLPLYRRTWLAKSRSGKRWNDWYFLADESHDLTHAVDWIFGACIIIRREALDRVGYLDEKFFLYLDDTDWCRRFWEHGYSVQYVPTVSVVHLHGRSSEGSIFSLLHNSTARAHIKSFIRYMIKYWGKQNPRAEARE